MPCENKKMTEMLIKYFDNELNEAERTEVEKHLKECSECSNQYKTMLFLDSGKSDPGNHIPPDLMADYYQYRDELDAEKIAAIESHLKECHQCAYELEFLNSMEQELYEAETAKPQPKSIFQQVLDFSRKLVLKPVLVYFLLLLTIYPVYKFLSSPLDNTRSPLHQSQVLPSLVLTSGTRSITGPPLADSSGLNQADDSLSGSNIPDSMTVNLLEKNPNDTLVYLEIQLTHNTQYYRYDFDLNYINSEDGSVFALTDQKKYISFDKKGSIGLILNTEGMRDGEYRLCISEIDIEDPSDTAISCFQFFLKTLIR